MPLSFDDMFRGMGVQGAGGGGVPAAGGVGSPAQFGPIQSQAWDPSQSSMWNLLNGRKQTQAEMTGANANWNPGQHQDVTSAWLAAGMPSQTAQGINTTGGGQAATWNGVQTNGGFGDSLRQQNMTPQGASNHANTMGMPGSYTNPQGPNMGRTQQQSWGNNYGTPNSFGSGSNPFTSQPASNPYGGNQTPGWGMQGRNPWGGTNPQRSGGKGGF